MASRTLSPESVATERRSTRLGGEGSGKLVLEITLASEDEEGSEPEPTDEPPSSWMVGVMCSSWKLSEKKTGMANMRGKQKT